MPCISTKLQGGGEE